MKAVKRAWAWLTHPLVPIADEEKRELASILTAVAAGAFLLILVSTALIAAIIYPEHREYFTLVMSLFACLFLVPYGLARCGRLQAAHLVFVSIGVTAIIGLSAVINNIVQTQHLYYLSLVTLYCATFVSLRWAARVTAVYSILILTVTPQLSDVPMIELVRGPLTFNIIVSLFILMFLYYWRQKDASRLRKLHEAQQRYDIISALSPHLMTYRPIGPDGKLELAQGWTLGAAERIFGYTNEEFDGNIDHDYLFPPEELARAKEDRQRALAGEETSGQYRIIRKDGTQGWISLTRMPERDSAGEKVIGAYVVCIDITEQKDREAEHFEAMMRREQYGLLKQFIRALSHDFRSRLSIVENSTYLLTKALAPADLDRASPRLNAIQQAGRGMRARLDELTVLATLQDPDMLVFDLNQIADIVPIRFRARAERAQLRFQVTTHAQSVRIHGDMGQIVAAVEHLLDNALRVMKPNGTLTLNIDSQGDNGIVEVSDTGPGIAPDKLAHIFDPFYKTDDARTVDEGGLGVGLTIVRLIVERHHGHVEVDSTLGVGSTFRLVLPLQPVLHAEAAAAEAVLEVERHP